MTFTRSQQDPAGTPPHRQELKERSAKPGNWGVSLSAPVVAERSVRHRCCLKEWMARQG
jgi:hypothetical protein